LLKSRFSSFVIVPDNDKVGIQSAKRLAKELYPLDVYIDVLPKTVKDVNELLIKYGIDETRKYLEVNKIKWRFKDG
jgi:DNA primase